MKLKPNTTAYACAFLANFMVVINGTIIKTIGLEFPVLQLAFCQFLIIALCLLPVMLKQKHLSKLPTQQETKHYLIRSMGGLVGLFCFFHGLTNINVTEVVILGRTFPIFLLGLGYLILKERLTSLKVAAALLGFVGALIAIKPSFNSSGIIFLVVLLGVFSDAFAATSIKKLTITQAPLKMIFTYAAIASCVLGVMMPWVWVSPKNPLTYIPIILIGLTALCYKYLYVVSYKNLNANTVGILTSSQMIFSITLGFILWGEVLEHHKYIGMGIVFLGLYMDYRSGIIMSEQFPDKRQKRIL